MATNTYIVTFEVKNPSKKAELEDKIKTYDNHCQIHANCWAITSKSTPVQIRDYLDKFLDRSDSIFVIRSGTYSAWRSVHSRDNSNWLKENL